MLDYISDFSLIFIHAAEKNLTISIIFTLVYVWPQKEANQISISREISEYPLIVKQV